MLKNKFKMVIADDEPFVREGLKVLVDWEKEDVEIVGVADNGIEALDLAVKNEANILITDIRMPGMNGIELAEEFKKRSSKFVSIIFISGYSDFKYAQQAVELNAISYVLKPIEENDLIRVVNEAKSRIIDNKKILEKNKSKNLSERIKRVLIKSEPTSIIANDVSPSIYRLIEIQPKDVIRNVNVELLNYWELNSNSNYYHFNFGVNEYILTEEMNLDIIYNFVDSIKSRQMLVYVSKSYNDLHRLYIDIKNMRKYSFLYPNEQIISPEIVDEKSLKTKFYDGYFEKDILDNIKQGNRDGIILLMNVYKEHLRHIHCDEESIKTQMSSLYSYILNKTKSERPTHLDIRSIYNSENIDELISVLENIIFDIIETEQEMYGKADIVQKVKDYTKNHYMHNLTLKSLGKTFNYNSAYLGKKFKDSTGEYYNDFLDTIRLESAKKLLIDSNLLIYEISAEVGYGNLDYFYRKFKDYTGMTPSDYRKEHVNV